MGIISAIISGLTGNIKPSKKPIKTVDDIYDGRVYAGLAPFLAMWGHDVLIPKETALNIENMAKEKNLGGLVKELQEVLGIPKKQVADIARDLANKISQSMSLVRVQSMGITHGVWMHRSGGMTFRESHVALDGEKFLFSEGAYDMEVGRNVLPGELISCRCTFVPVLPE